MAAAGWGAHAVFGGSDEAPRPKARPNAAAIRIGPVADMPDIRNGVPALASSVPPRDPGLRPSEAAPLAAATGRGPESPASRAPSSDEAANARAMAATVAAGTFRPALQPRIAETLAQAQPRGPIATPLSASVGATPPSEPAPAPRSEIAAPASAARVVDVRQPVASDPNRAAVEVAPAPASGEEPASAPVAIRPVEPEAAPAPRVVNAPLPPARPAERVAEASADRAVVPTERPRPSTDRGGQPPERVGATFRAPTLPAARPPAASPAAAKPASAPPAATASLAPPASPAPARSVASASDDVEVFGVPLPGLAPTGRRLRDAASSLADTVTSLPDRF